MELKKCKCGQDIRFDWREECEECSITICSCGKSTETEWKTECDDCRKKQDKKFIIQLVIGVFVAILVVSLFFATVLEYQNQIDSFFKGIEKWTITFYNSLSSFVQNFLLALSVGLTALFVVLCFGFLFVSLER